MTTNDTERLERDLEAAFAVEVPRLAFEAPALRARRNRAATWRVGVATGLAAAAMVGAVLSVPNSAGGGKTASAEELVQRSIAASSSVRADGSIYHLITVARTNDSEQRTETWAGGSNRYLTESRFTVGGVTWIEGSAMSGGEMWLFQGPAGDLTVAHGPAVYHVHPGPPAVPLEQVLAGWTESGCFDAEVAGMEQIVGRETHVVVVTPTPETCSHAPKPLRRATLWIDVENDFMLKSSLESETTEHSSSLEVVLFETFDSLPDSAFAYSPPEGATVVEFTDLAGLKEALAAPVIVPRGSRVIIEHDWRVPANPD